jgi:tocopherol O-methyltransferase
MIVASEPQSMEAVALHYDELDVFYREIWGRHVHHGLWQTGRETQEEAADLLVDRLAERLALRPGQNVCDVGCGYGETALRLADRNGVQVTGLTISPVQAEHASLSIRNAPMVTIACQDWLSNTFRDEAFDAVYSIESSEHMVDKNRFFTEAWRTLRPGGRLGLYAWLAREGTRPWEVRYLLEPICREGRLPSIGTENNYCDMAQKAGFTVELVDDLSRSVRRTWTICARRVAMKLVLEPAYRRFVRDKGAANRIFVVTLLRLVVAYRTGSMRYCLFILTRPL